MASPRKSEIIDWLKSDENASRTSRARRIVKLLKIMPLPEEGFGLHDGDASPYLFNEARLAYTNGLYLSVVLVSLALIERQIAARLDLRGHEDAAKLNMGELLKIALAARLLEQSEVDAINELRAIRNAYAHFRVTLHEQSIIARAIKEDSEPAKVLERDAEKALKLLAALINEGAFNI